MPDDVAGMSRFLVLHDYGMGGLWWWISAPNEAAILDTFAEVEIVSDNAWVESVSTWQPPLKEVTIGGPYPPGLSDLAAKRDEQRKEPGYSALAGAPRVYLKRDDPEEEGVVWFSELGPDGRRLREIERRADGTAVGRSQWIMNPPEDLRDPELARHVCTVEEFESVWRSATVVDD
jgi:hypothetical protein